MKKRTKTVTVTYAFKIFARAITSELTRFSDRLLYTILNTVEHLNNLNLLLLPYTLRNGYAGSGSTRSSIIINTIYLNKFTIPESNGSINNVTALSSVCIFCPQFPVPRLQSLKKLDFGSNSFPGIDTKQV